jgi:hypothetical protein
MDPFAALSKIKAMAPELGWRSMYSVRLRGLTVTVLLSRVVPEGFQTSGKFVVVSVLTQTKNRYDDPSDGRNVSQSVTADLPKSQYCTGYFCWYF